MKKRNLTKEETVDYINNNFPDEGITIVLSNKFNFYTWLNIVLLSSILSALLTLLICDLWLNVPNGFIGFLKFGVFLFIPSILSALIVKFFEFRYKYQVK
jgi:hypothetical protein